MSIMEKAHDLANELMESKEYAQLKAAEETVMANEDSKNLLNEFQSKQQQLQMAQMNGHQVTQKQKNDINAVQAKMKQNPQIKDYIEAQQNFHKVMESVNTVIGDAMQGKSDNNKE